MECLIFTVQFLKTIVLVIFSIFRAIVIFFIPTRCRIKDVTNKLVLITGAGSGLGAALAVRFAKRKSKLILWDINTDGLKATMEECRKYQSELFIHTFKVDVTNRTQVLEVADKIKNEIGFVDILINNAGIVSGKSILELDEATVFRSFNVNAISHFWTVQAFLPEMFAKNSGHIVSISSLAGCFGINKLSDYCASKFAAIGFQESLESEIRAAKKFGIQCLTVCPFYINTGMFDGVKSQPLLHILELEYATKKIETAILSNYSILYMPRITYLFSPLKYMLPQKGMLYIINLLKVDQSMDSFVGRK